VSILSPIHNSKFQLANDLIIVFGLEMYELKFRILIGGIQIEQTTEVRMTKDKIRQHQEVYR